MRAPLQCSGTDRRGKKREARPLSLCIQMVAAWSRLTDDETLCSLCKLAQQKIYLSFHILSLRVYACACEMSRTEEFLCQSAPAGLNSLHLEGAQPAVSTSLCGTVHSSIIIMKSY